MATSPIFRAAPTTLRRRREGPEQTSLTLFPTAARHGTCEQPSDASAPPEPIPTESGSPLPTKPTTELVGIARLAASSLRAEAKRGTEYFLLPVRSILNYCDSERVPFRWTVNPYRGCEFGCKYCYARYTHEYMDIDGGEFESKIYVKKDAGALVDRDLSTEKIWGEHIAIGTATDPYQPAEREFGATRAILEKMALREGLRLSITTKSDQVVRDIDLLRRIAERSSITVNLSITTLRPHLARLLEPRAPRPSILPFPPRRPPRGRFREPGAPRPARRRAAVRRLREGGISAGVFAMP